MTPRPNARPLAAYVRVSTAGQAASGIGLEAQRATITQAAEAGGFTIGEWFEDAGKSGAKMQNRPGLQAALAAIRRGELGGLVVGKVDRLGRTYETMMLVGEAAREGWRLVAVDVGLDTTTAEGELVAGALTMAARFEWRRISQRQLEKHAELRKQNRRRGRPAADPAVADRITELRDAGESFRAIAARLSAEGVPTARGAVAWTAPSVRSAMLTRRREIATQAA